MNGSSWDRVRHRSIDEGGTIDIFGIYRCAQDRERDLQLTARIAERVVNAP